VLRICSVLQLSPELFRHTCSLYVVHKRHVSAARFRSLKVFNVHSTTHIKLCTNAIRQQNTTATIIAVTVAVCRNGNSVGRINEVTIRRDRLVLRWVTVFGRANHLGCNRPCSQASSASYPQRDGKRVPAKVQCSAAGE